MKKQSYPTGLFLTFTLNEALFAVSIERMLEIMGIGQVTEVHKLPDHVYGIVHVGRNIIPVINTNRYLGNHTTKTPVNSPVLIVRARRFNTNVFLGLIVDSVDEIMEIPQTASGEFADLNANFRREQKQGIRKADENFITLLDTDRISSETMFEW